LEAWAVTRKPHAITKDRDIQGGTPEFVGTRVPVAVPLDHLAAGQSLDDFLAQYPSVSRAVAAEALEEIKHIVAVA
jgi:uncharacterized protein (DUF433 family)